VLSREIGGDQAGDVFFDTKMMVAPVIGTPNFWIFGVYIEGEGGGGGGGKGGVWDKLG
jgi:hypothetical protein